MPQIDQLISVKNEIDSRDWDLTSRQVWKLVGSPVFGQVRSEVYVEVNNINTEFRTHVQLQLRDRMYEIRQA